MGIVSCLRRSLVSGNFLVGNALNGTFIDSQLIIFLNLDTEVGVASCNAKQLNMIVDVSE